MTVRRSPGGARGASRILRRAAGPVAGTLALLAVLPSVLPYDHLAAGRFARGDHTSHDPAEEHALHCHVEPAACADAPLPAGPGEMYGGEPLLVVPPALLAPVERQHAAWTGLLLRPPRRPPVRDA